jgi:hypothetical protein
LGFVLAIMAEVTRLPSNLADIEAGRGEVNYFCLGTALTSGGLFIVIAERV